MCWNPKYALLMLTSTAITYASGLLIERASSVRGKRWCVAVSFCANLAILFFFKYFYFALDNVNALLQHFGFAVLQPKFDVVLPVGISFYTFQALSYTADVYRRRIPAERNFFRYALFVSFFPQLVAGPIERTENLLPQLQNPKPFDYLRARRGLVMAQTVAFQFWILSRHDRADAWTRYLRFVDAGGTKTFRELCEDSGIDVPYEPGCIRRIGSAVSEWISACRL